MRTIQPTRRVATTAAPGRTFSKIPREVLIERRVRGHDAGNRGSQATQDVLDDGVYMDSVGHGSANAEVVKRRTGYVHLQERAAGTPYGHDPQVRIGLNLGNQVRGMRVAM